MSRAAPRTTASTIVPIIDDDYSSTHQAPRRGRILRWRNRGLDLAPTWCTLSESDIWHNWVTEVWGAPLAITTPLDTQQ